MKKVSISLNERLVQHLRAIGTLESRTLHRVIVHACEEYVGSRAQPENAYQLENHPGEDEQAFVQWIKDLGRY